tara:strand:- start:1268 stop:2020 length:753 start_codon:yes stop_codon:yes gene_type:complete
MEDTMHENTTIEGVEGEVLETVVEPENVGGNPVEATGEVIDEAKKFQSMYDKKAADYDKLNNELEELRKYEQLGKVLQDRPDVVEAMRNTLSGNAASKEEAPKVTEDSFDPWEAYYKPGSPSYEMRVTQEKAVAQQAVQEQMAGFQQQMAINNLKQDLATKHGISDPKMAEDFIQFATTPREEIPLDMLVDVYRRYKGGEEKVSPNLEAVQKTQTIPTTAGVVQGSAPEQPNELDDVWKGVMNSSRNTKI